MYQWYGGFMVPASLAFRAGGQPEKRLLLAHHRSLDWLHVPAKQLPSRAPVLPSRSHRNGNKSETQGADGTYIPMLQNWIQRTGRSGRVMVVISAFESDGQLVYLLNAGVVDYLICDDSDLMSLGAP